MKAIIPGESMTPSGIEFFVEAQDTAGQRGPRAEGFSGDNVFRKRHAVAEPERLHHAVRLPAETGAGLPRAGHGPRPSAGRPGAVAYRPASTAGEYKTLPDEASVLRFLRDRRAEP